MSKRNNKLDRVRQVRLDPEAYEILKSSIEKNPYKPSLSRLVNAIVLQWDRTIKAMQ